MRFVAVALAILVLILSGCAKKNKQTYYEIPKSEITESTPKPVASEKPTATPANSPPVPSETPKIDSNNTKHDDKDYPELMNLMYAYAHSLVDAINTGDFSLVEEYLLEGSSLYYSQKALVNNLFSYGTTEKIESIEKIEENWESPDKCFVSTREVATISYKSGKEETNTYFWTYTVVRKDGKYYLSDIKKYEK